MVCGGRGKRGALTASKQQHLSDSSGYRRQALIRPVLAPQLVLLLTVLLVCSCCCWCR